MKAISFLLATGFVVSCFGQAGVIAQGSVNQSNFGFYWQSRLEPPTPPLANSMGYGSGYGNNAVYRVMIDRSTRVYFGYEVRVQPQLYMAPVTQPTYRLTFQPLNLSADTMKRLSIDDAGWKKLDLGLPVGRPLNPLRQAPDIVAELDVVAVDLMMNPTTNQKIVDYFVLQGPRQGWSFNQLDAIKPEFSYPTGEPRDFGVEDASLRIMDAHLKMNGKLEEVVSSNDLAGPIVWLYVPNHGRYILTLAAHPEAGFRKAGEVRGTSLSFTVGDDKFSLTSTKPITAADAAFNLYVLQDASWKPTYPNAATSSFMMGLADPELMGFLNRLGFRKVKP
jgi:hypothetical protein